MADTKKTVQEVKQEAAKAVETAKQEAAKAVAEAKPAVEKAAAEAKKTVKSAQKKATKATVKATAKAKDSVKRAADKAVKGETAPVVYVQYQGAEEKVEDLVAAAKAAFAAEHSRTKVADLKLYIKPEERAAYYVVNEKFAGRVDF